MELSAFYPLIATEVIGCPIPVIESVVRLTATEFCRESLSWVEPTTVSLVAGTSGYGLTLPTDAMLLTVRDASISGLLLRPATHEQLVGMGESQEPWFFNLASDRTQVTFAPTPSKTGVSVILRAIYTPTPTAQTLPDFLWTHYAEAIASGAKSKLMLMPEVAWNSPSYAAYHRTVFDAAIGQARIYEAHGRVPGSLRVKPVQFGY